MFRARHLGSQTAILASSLRVNEDPAFDCRCQMICHGFRGNFHRMLSIGIALIIILMATPGLVVASDQDTKDRQFFLSVSVNGAGMVTSTPKGLQCSNGTCTAEFPKNTKVRLRSTPHDGQVFDRWSGACGGKKPCTVKLSKHRTVRAKFSPPPTTRLTVQVKGGGKVISEPKGIACEQGTCRGTFPKGVRVILTAVPNDGQIFAKWQNACRGSKGCKVTLNKNRTVLARFAPPPTARLTVQVKGGGKVISQPEGIACDQGTCRGTFPKGARVILTAMPSDGQIFAKWQNACRGSKDCKVTLNKNRTVFARFTEPPTVRLTVKVKGGGKVISEPEGIACEQGTCRGAFPKGTQVTLAAMPIEGQTFTRWKDACKGTGSCKITLKKNRNVYAEFSETKTVALTVSLTTGGTVTSTPDGLICEERLCVGKFPVGAKVTLMAKPNDSHMLEEWSGACSGKEACVVELKETTKVSASFMETSSTVALTVTVLGEGTVASMPEGLSCTGNTCTGQFPLNAEVTLEPMPGTNYAFSQWGESCSGDGQCAVKLTAPKTVTVTFISAQTFSLTVTTSGNGTVISTPAGLSCSGNTCTGQFPAGDSVRLTSVPDAGYELKEWGGACNGAGICSVGLKGATTVTLAFQVSMTGSTDADAKRFLEQATWGPTSTSIAHLKDVGKQAFLVEQFAATPSTYPNPADGNNNLNDVRAQFFYNAFQGNDQLRQRVAFALGQLFVVSANTVGDDEQMIPYLRILHSHAFGNFRDLMRAVTLSPTMGRFLDMVNNDKTEPGSGLNPNENYARELLQLFTIGTITLNQNGTERTDGNGMSLPPYDENVIVNLARVFTGWTYPTRPGETPRWRNRSYYNGSMEAIESHHDTGEKTLMNGVILSAGQNAQADLDAALQHIFSHSNVAPFVATRLIRNLVTSNPSPQYVLRVANIFTTSGGDLQAVISAVLLDQEASTTTQNGGHLREPVVFGLALLRALDATVGPTNSLYSRVRDMGQSLFTPPSVFNYFSPLYKNPGSTLFAPEFQIYTYSTAFARANFVNRTIRGGLGDAVNVDLSRFEALADDLNQLVNAVEQGLLHEPLSAQERQSIFTALAVTDDPRTRARNAVYLVATSARYQVQH